MQLYRDSASFFVRLSPEAAAEKLIGAAGGAGKVRVFRSRVGYTVVIFIENKSREPFSSIQVSGLKGKSGSTIIFTRQRAITGWKWQFFKKPKKHWDYR